MTASVSAEELLRTVRTIAHEAGQVILRYYTDHIAVETKHDGSPVTEADRAAEAVILPALRHLGDIPIVSEEAFAAGDRPHVDGHPGSGRFWLVDPLDGTKEFISRNGEFTVNIALVEGGRPVLGVVYAPVTGDLYAGAAPGSAIHHRDDRRVDRPIAVRAPPAEGLVVVESRSHGDQGELGRYLAGFKVQDRIRRGSSLKFCAVAAGEADLYARFGSTTHEWDTAAGHAVLAAAGGQVTTEDGKPLAYGKPGFRNPTFIARGAG